MKVGKVYVAIGIRDYNCFCLCVFNSRKYALSQLNFLKNKYSSFDDIYIESRLIYFE